jgi:hypothetical protein
MNRNVFVRLSRLAAVTAAAVLAGCGGDNVLPRSRTESVEVVLNSVSNSLTLLSPDSVNPTVRTVGLGAQGTPVGVAARGAFAVVPLGVYPFAAVVDLRSGVVIHTAALPAGSGATGVAFLNDSVAFVANPNRNTVSPVNVQTGGVGAEVPVGPYPQAIVSTPGFVFVLNANLANFAPAGPGSVSMIGSNGKVSATIPLTGFNPQAGVVAGTRLYVLNAGHFGQADGSVSVVNLVTRTEELNAPGFGEFPGSIAVGVDGNLYVSVYSTGVVVWDPGVRNFVRGLNDPIVPGGSAPVSAVAFDQVGRMHTLNPGNCSAAGKEFRVTSVFTVDRTVTTGVCPFAMAFSELVPVD